MRRRTFALAFVVGHLLPAASQAGQVPEAFDLQAVRAARRIAAVRIAEAIRIDGILDESAWELARPATDFYQQRPAEFAPASRPTEVRFLYDDATLYVGARMFDEAPHLLITNELRRDFSGFSNDLFAVVLDTFLDERTGYGFLTNPGGAKRDTLALENGRNNANWDGVWFLETAVTDGGWTAEFAIPFKTLRFPRRDLQEWGLHLMRLVRRDYEFSLWSPVPRQFSNPQYSLAYAGVLTGISGVEQGRGLQVTPFATAQLGHGGPSGDAWDGEADGGVDVKWGLTSSLVLNGTFRTDFSQVEADEQQINLTRFSLFFPEKRQFFLESPASFQIGLSAVETERRDLVPFFSRRIGLSDVGQPVPVLGGLRLVGQAGQYGIGLLTMQTEKVDDAPGANFTAARITKNLTPTSAIGAFYLGRESGDADGFNRIAGLDLRITPRPTLEIEGFAMRSQSEGRSSGWAGRTGFRLETDRHRARGGLVHVGEHFRHDLGFVRQPGIATVFGGYERVLQPRDTSRLVREYSLLVDGESTSDDEYGPWFTRLAGAGYGMTFRDASTFTVRANTTDERLAEAFEVGGDLTVEPGEYSYQDVDIQYRSNASAPFSGTAGLQAGEFWTGRRRSLNGSARFRLNAHLAASASLTRNQITLPQGRFTAHLLAMRVDWSFTPAMFLNAFVQYNEANDTWLSNVRFNLIHRPLSDIYVVWNETRRGGDARRAVLFKYSHLLAF
jgi:hypothetical protein